MAKEEMTALDWVATVLVVVGGLNWGLVGVGMLATTNLNLVNLIFGSIPTLEAIVYLLVGLSAVWALVKLFKK
ncbi:DUF378 domain-containing protein [Candidatus Woesearchaeota archaeon]|nr:DUF378 domain-containing protein [Candidatus Woesearchaeota archaeon]